MAVIPYEVKSLKRGTLHVEGSFAVDGSGDPTTIKGIGFSVAHTTTGVYTITFSDKYQDLISADVSLMYNALEDKVVQLGAWSKTNSTLVIRVYDISGTGAADIASATNDRIQFDVCLQWSKY